VLPVFAAADLNRLPSLRMEDLDVTVLANKLSMLEAKVSKHDQLLNETKPMPTSPTMVCDVCDQMLTCQVSAQSAVGDEPLRLVSQPADMAKERTTMTAETDEICASCS